MSSETFAFDDPDGSDGIADAEDEEDSVPPEKDFDIPPRPALKALLHDQRALVEPSETDYAVYALRSGFPTRRRIVEWFQRAIVRTFGYIVEDCPPEQIVRDDVLVDALLEPESGTDAELCAAARESSTRLSPQSRRQYRRRFEAAVVQPACTKAYQDLRGGATEYVFGPDDEEGPSPSDLIPDEQEHVAMRPGFQQLDREQRETLARLWGGFESYDELLDWTHTLNAPTNGEMRPSFGTELLNDPAAMDFLLHDRRASGAREFRAQIAVQELLPAFAAGITSTSPTELAQRKTTGQKTFQFD